MADFSAFYPAGNNTVSSVGAVNTTKAEQDRVREIRRREILDSYPGTSIGAPSGREVPEPSVRERWEQFFERQRALAAPSDPDVMLGERMNPIVIAPMLALGIPETAATTLVTAGISAGTMVGLETLKEKHPRAATLVNLALTAMTIYGLSRSTVRSLSRTVNDVLAEPTEAKLNLLYEMTRAAAKNKKSASPGPLETQVTKGLQELLGVDNLPKSLPAPERAGLLEWNGRAGSLRPSRPGARDGVSKPVPPSAVQTTSAGRVWTMANESQVPIRQSRWYTDLVQRYGTEEAEAMARFVSDPAYPDYFLPPGPHGEDAFGEIMKYADARKIIRDITEPGEIVVGGSSGINLEGTIERETAVPHDLDFAGYIANASRRSDIPFFQKDGRPLSPQVRDEMYAALADHANIENAPIIQKLRKLYPDELGGAKFRYASYDWEFGGGTQYEPGMFTVVKRPDITDAGNGNTLVTTMLKGNKVDIMLSDAQMELNSVDPRYGSADTAFDWKDYYGWRPKDLKDKATYAEFSKDNPVASAVSGRARFSPSRFGDSLVTDEGLPVVVDIEQTPGGPTVPMVMNHRGVMLQANDPGVLQIYNRYNPINDPRFAHPATAADKPLAAVRLADSIVRKSGASGEAAPSIGVYRADQLEQLADHLIQWANPAGQDDIVVYRGGATVDPAANLANVLYSQNAVTGGPHSFWPAKGTPGSAAMSSYPARKALVNSALWDPTPENLEALGRAFGESTRGDAGLLVNRVDNRLRNMLHSRPVAEYAEAKPGRYVPDTEAAGVLSSADPNLRDNLIKLLRDNRFAIPLLTAAGLYNESGDEPENPEVQQDAKGGDNFALSRNFLATDEVPETIFGIPVVQGGYSEADAAFFRDNPKAAGFYEMGGEEVDEGTPQQGVGAGKTYGKRPDGTEKGGGWFGELKLPDGGVATEYSVGVNIGGKEVDIPTLVPLLTKAEREAMVNDVIPNRRPIPEPIMQKAVAWAKDRIAGGRSPFANAEETYIRTRGAYPGESNNPGNVEKHERRTDKTPFVDEDTGGVRPKRFARFRDPVGGLHAAAATIARHAEELEAAGQAFSIENYAPRYAPETENDTEAYIGNLSKYSGLDRAAKLDRNDAASMAKLLKTVVRFESGRPHSEWFTDSEYKAAAETMAKPAAKKGGK